MSDFAKKQFDKIAANPDLKAPVPQYKTFNEVLFNDPTVLHAFNEHRSLKDMVIILANQKRQLLRQVIQLEAIAPKKIQNGDQVFIWHCPDELIPLQK